MKSVYCLCVFVLVLLSQNTNGGLVRGFFEKVHDAAHKVHDDIHNAFHPTERPKQTVSVANLPDSKKTAEPIFIFVTVPATPTATPAATPVVPPNKDNTDVNRNVIFGQGYKPNEEIDDGQLIFASNPAPQPAVTPPAVTPPTVTPPAVTPPPVNNSNSTEKDGKENFFGGCSTGYKKTADGRCKPTF